VILGIIRERTGGIMIGTVFHTMVDFVAWSFGRVSGFIFSNIAVMVAIFIFIASFFERILKGGSSI